MMKRLAALQNRHMLGFALILCALWAMPAHGGDQSEITFRFTNQAASPVLVRLYSADRDLTWPRDGQLFILADRAPRKFAVGCELGEQICYGAWVEGDFTRFWGAGHEGKAVCDDCCRICEENAEMPLYQVEFQ